MKGRGGTRIGRAGQRHKIRPRIEPLDIEAGADKRCQREHHDVIGEERREQPVRRSAR